MISLPHTCSSTDLEAAFETLTHRIGMLDVEASDTTLDDVDEQALEIIDCLNRKGVWHTLSAADLDLLRCCRSDNPGTATARLLTNIISRF